MLGIFATVSSAEIPAESPAMIDPPKGVMP